MKKNVGKRLLALCLAAALLSGLVPGTAAAGAASAGRVTYLIGSAEQLAEVVAAYNAGTLHAKLGIQPGALVLALMADIDLTGRDFDLSGWGGYPPLGTQAQPFRDRFDGQGHAIRGLRLDSSAASQGLFGVVAAGGVVENLALTGCSVTGTGQVGGVAGVNRGVIRNCLVSGFVSAQGTGEEVGGICGENGGKVERCVVTADVGGAGNRAVGGIAGELTSGGTVTGCAMLGSAVFGASDVGAAAGLTGGADLSGNLHWSGMSGGFTPQGTEVDAAGLEVPANWPEGLKAEPWTYEAGKLPGLGGQALDLPASLESLPGGLTENNPIAISDYAGLLAFARSVNAGNAYMGRFIKVTQNIDIQPGDAAWTPIDGFAGTFDGGGYTISGLTVPRDEDSRKYGVGLFGAFYGGAPVIKNVHLTGCDITGYAVVGGIVGYGTGATVSRCSVQGTVTALNKDVGGVCGAVIDGSVSECYANVTVYSEWGAGGIVSYLEDATVENCVSAGLVSAKYASSVGGLAAHLETERSQVLSSYTLAAVESQESNRRGVHAGVGGAVGASTGEIHNVVSINKYIRTFGPEVGRTAGKFVGHEGASDNISWLMPGNRRGVPAKGSTGYTAAELRGGDPDWAQVPKDKLWAGFDSSVWDLNGDLPALRNLPAGAQGGGSWPGWLTDSAKDLYQRPQTEGNTYIINTAAELAWLSRQENSALEGKTIDIRRNLSLKDYQEGEGWTPIGSKTGMDATSSLTVSGNDNTISDLYISSSECLRVGLFGSLEKARITGIRLENAYVESREWESKSLVAVGGIVAACGRESLIANCSFNGTVRGLAGTTGGIAGSCGHSDDFSYIMNCSSSGAVGATVMHGSKYFITHAVGGIVGSATNTDITGCFNSAQVASTYRKGDVTPSAGGIAGIWGNYYELAQKKSARFSDNYNRGSVSTDKGEAGGLIGTVRCTMDVVITSAPEPVPASIGISRSYSLGSVESPATAGGLIGKIFPEPYNSWNLGTEAEFSLTRVNAIGLLAMNKRVSAAEPSTGEEQTVLPGAGITEVFYDQPTPNWWFEHVALSSAGNLYWDGMALEQDGQALPVGGNRLEIFPMNTQVLLGNYLSQSSVWPSPWVRANRGLPILKDTPGEQSHGLPPYLYLKGGAALGPIAIYTAEDMEDLRELMLVYREESDWTDITIDLMADIDMTGASWEPLNTFQGTFNGNGHVLRNLNVYTWSADPAGGLFRKLTGRVTDLGLVDCKVTAPRAEAVGALAGTASGQVSGCYAAETPSGQNDGDLAPHVSGKGSVGGLVGRFSGDIRDCYTALNVYSSEGSAGGLAGELGSGLTRVERCFTAGAVKAAEYAGGLAGKAKSDLYTPALSGCLALNRLISGNVGSGGIVGTGTWSPGAGNNYVWSGMPSTLTPPQGNQYQAESLYGIKSALGTVFGGSSGVWSPLSDSTPILWNIRAQQYSYLPVEFTPGTLRKDSGVYLIKTAQDLQTMAENVSLGYQDYARAAYRVTADLDLSTLMGWQPIDGFYGTFDGGGHTLSGLRVSLADQENGGLFGRVHAGGTVKDFTLEAHYTGATKQNGTVGGVAAVMAGAVEGVTFRGSLEASSERTGGIAGFVEAGGRVAGCVNEAAVQNTQSNGYAGGIAGVVTGLVETCVNGGTVKSAGAAGGVAGGISGGTVEQCLNTGAVTGSGSAGGVAGRVSKVDGTPGVVRDCHASARVESGYTAGGVAGTVDEGITVSSIYNRVEHCYATGQVKGKIVGGIAGINQGVAEGCVALSASLEGGERDWGRIAGAGGGSAFQCFAWTDMTGADPDSSVTGVTSGELRTCGFWSGAGFGLDQVWTKAEGEPLLPRLTALGRGGELPLHLMEQARVELPQIRQQPQGSTVTTGTEVTLEVIASLSGGGALRYQWYETTVDGPTDHDTAVGDDRSSYMLADTSAAGSRYFYVEVTNTVGSVSRSVRSGVATVEVVADSLIGFIRVDSDVWEQYIPPQSVAFHGFCYKSAQTVEIGGDPPAGADVGQVRYLLCEDPVEKQNLPSEPGWEAYTEPFELSPNRSVIIYAHVTDSNGNEVYVNSQGLVFDNTPPTVADYTPSGGNAPVRGTLQIDFSEPMDPAAGSVVLEGEESVSLSPALGLWSDPRTYEIEYAGLEGERTYAVVVSGFQDRAGNSMEEDRTHRFTTAAQETEPSPVYPGADPQSLRLDLNGASSGNVLVSLGQYGGEAGRVTVTNGAPEALALSAEGVQYGDFTLTVTGKQTVSGAAVTLLFDGRRLTSTRTVTVTVDVIASQPSGGGDGSVPSGIAIETPQPPRPVEAVVDLELAVKDGQATGAVDGSRTASALRQALAAAKRLDREEYGVALRYRARTRADYGGYTVVLDRGDLERLVEAGVKYVKLDTAAVDLTFDLAALGAVLAQSRGDVALSAREAGDLSGDLLAAVGQRPAYRLEASFTDRTGQPAKVTDFGAGRCTVDIGYAPAEGERPGDLFLAHGAGEVGMEWLYYPGFQEGQGVVSGKTGKFSLFGVGYKPAPAFADTVGHWAREEIAYAAQREIFQGTGEGRFSPDLTLTRAMFVTALWRLAGSPQAAGEGPAFPDVPAGRWYSDAVAWGTAQGIVSGTGSGFSPDRPITREELAVLLYRYAGRLGYALPGDLEAAEFTDGATISAWAADAVASMQRAGLMTGRDGGRFDPAATATRAEAAVVFQRFTVLCAAG